MNRGSYINDGISNILGDMTAIGAAITRAPLPAPALTPEQIRAELERCKQFLATAGRGEGADPAKITACQLFIEKHDPAYIAAAKQKMIDHCMLTVATVKTLPNSDKLDMDWEKQRDICRKLLTDWGVTIPGEGPAPGTTQDSVTGLGLAFLADQLPVYISIPVILYTLYHTRNVWMQHIPFITNK